MASSGLARLKPLCHEPGLMKLFSDWFMMVFPYTKLKSVLNVFVIKSKELYAADPEGARLGATNGAYTGTGFASAMPRRYLVGAHLSF